MFRGFWGCALAWAGLVAGAVYGDLVILLVGTGLGLSWAAASCWVAERKLRAAKNRKLASYPPYGY